MKHVMIDLETLGTVADAAILSIGAVRFDLDSDAIDDQGFYASVSLDSNSEYKRRIQENTLIWWLRQPVEAQSVFHESKQRLPDALDGLADWMKCDKHTCVWSNGADFDLPMVAHAFAQHQMEVPWKFWNSNCFRTYKKLPGAKQIRAENLGVKHNALSDAFTQAKTLQLIQKALFGNKTHSMVKSK